MNLACRVGILRDRPGRIVPTILVPSIAVLSAMLIAGQNLALSLATALAIGSCLVAGLIPGYGLAVFFAWIPLSDLIKRLLFAVGEAEVTQLEYYWTLALPDLVLGALVARAGLELARNRSLPFKLNVLDALVAGYLGWSALTMLNPAFPLVVRLAGFKSSSIYVTLYFVVRYLDSSDRHWLLRLKRVVVAGASVSAAYGLYQGLFGFQQFELKWLRSGLSELSGGEQGLGDTIAYFGIVRPFSTFASHEQLGWYLGSAILFMLMSPKRNWLGWMLLGLLSLGLARTLSRSAWVFLGSALLVVAALALLANYKKLILGGIIVAAMFLAAVGLWAYGPRDLQGPIAGTEVGAEVDAEVGAEVGAEDGSAYVRRASLLGSYVWRTYSFSELVNNPEWHRPFGNGIGSMWVGWRLDAPGTKNPQSLEAKGPGERILSHVGLADVAYELGILGLALFLAIFGVLALRSLSCLRRMRVEGPDPALLCALAASIAVVIAISSVTTVLMFRPIAAPFWVMVGLASSRADKYSVRRTDPGNRDL